MNWPLKGPSPCGSTLTAEADALGALVVEVDVAEVDEGWLMVDEVDRARVDEAGASVDELDSVEARWEVAPDSAGAFCVTSVVVNAGVLVDVVLTTEVARDVADTVEAPTRVDPAAVVERGLQLPSARRSTLRFLPLADLAAELLLRCSAATRIALRSCVPRRPAAWRLKREESRASAT